RVITTSANGAQFVVASDLDLDGDLDLVSASRIDDTLAVYTNQLVSGGGPAVPIPPVVTPPVGVPPRSTPEQSGGTMRNVRNGRCLQPEDGFPSVGDPVSAKTCNGSSAQSLNFTSNGDGTFQIDIAGLCLGSPSGAYGNGTRVQLQACDGSASQRFMIVGTRFSPADASGRVVDLHGQNNNDVIFWADYGSTNQRWNR
ncbi:MAG: RICIN domain-containing protein, partial [Panacagrimonas sp.]